jgi:hypothetical protein
VTELTHARDEIKKGNTTGALSQLEAAQKALNATRDDGNNLAQQMLRNIH